MPDMRRVVRKKIRRKLEIGPGTIEQALSDVVFPTSCRRIPHRQDAVFPIPAGRQTTGGELRCPPTPVKQPPAVSVTTPNLQTICQPLASWRSVCC